MSDNKSILKQKVFGLLDDADLDNAKEIVERLDGLNFFTAPASTKYHGSYPGGLAEHSMNVTNALVGLTKDLSITWQNPRSPYIIGLMHDLCKCDSYKHPAAGKLNNQPIYDPASYEHNPNTLLKGHGSKSVMMASTLLQLTEEEVLCIRYHMGAFTEKEEWSDYTRAIHKYPTVLFTHTADMIAAHITEVK